MNMTCQWDKEWAPTHQLPECDWIACLRPPLPPSSTNLRITDWDGRPIPFGGTARYVCERGYLFEDDSSQIDQIYTCQEEITRGFFDTPETENEWPRCLEGKHSKKHFNPAHKHLC